MFNLPIITITAFIGFISGLNLSYEYIHIILGGMSLYASLLKSYFTYLKVSQKSENHRIAYIQYGQIANEIRIELALEPSLRKASGGLIDLIRIKMKNLLEVSEIIDTSVIHAYLSKIEPSKHSELMNWFTQTPNGSHSMNDHDALGRPHVLKLANRVESYVDIENKVLKLPNAGRSTSAPSSPIGIYANSSMKSNANTNHPGPTETDTNMTTDTESNHSVHGIMVKAKRI